MKLNTSGDFLHYWGTGPTTKLATGFKAALEQLGKK
jgi:hypothetical protein